ncbi:MAG: LytTR family DNA-binding domain-containing protein [Bacteroidota bacterium]
MIRCIAIDDEALAHKITRSYCEKLDFIDLKATFNNSIEALSYLKAHTVDLIFLDINMPELNGLDFLRTLINPPKIIIISAHQQHALESYEFDVTDYLLKPYGFERFLKAINKVGNQLSTTKSKEIHQLKVENQAESIFVKSGNKTHQVNLDDILFLESAGSYVKIHLGNEIITTLDRLTNFEKKLSTQKFARVHRSFIIAKRKIRFVEGNRISISDHEIPIGQLYKSNLKDITY